MDSKTYISQNLGDLTKTQAKFIETLVKALKEPYVKISRSNNSDLVSQSVLEGFGDYLRIHHCFSKLPFTKDKFEYALEEVLKLSGVQAKLAPKGNPGHDISINGVKFSLKSQADRSIKKDRIHISKFMELGKGEWSDKVEHLEGLRKQFLKHMQSYDRVLTLRCLEKEGNKYRYELVEIPKALLIEAKKGKLRIMASSAQLPKPGYCDVTDAAGNNKFQLYFDGGGERKLQIKNILKKYCTVHAEWEFSVAEIDL